MPSKSNKRIKPVIEEITEEPPKEKEDKVEESAETKPVETKIEQEIPKSEEPSGDEVKEEDIKTEKPKTESKKINFKLIIVITIISALVAAFVSGGVYVYLSGLSNLNEPEPTSTPEPSPTPSPEVTATPEPEENVSVSEYSVQVLNGSGAIGAASSGKDVLSKAGFSVKSIGNAAENNFDKTMVQAKSTVSAAVVNEVKKSLEAADYEVNVGEALSSSKEYDIIVTVGSN